jgi:hypothetical protein
VGWFCAGEMGLCWGGGVGGSRGGLPDGMGKRGVVGVFFGCGGGFGGGGWCCWGFRGLLFLVSWFLSLGLVVIGLGSLGSDSMVFCSSNLGGGGALLRFREECWCGMLRRLCWSCAVGKVACNRIESDSIASRMMIGKKAEVDFAVVRRPG